MLYDKLVRVGVLFCTLIKQCWVTRCCGSTCDLEGLRCPSCAFLVGKTQLHTLFLCVHTCLVFIRQTRAHEYSLDHSETFVLQQLILTS